MGLENGLLTDQQLRSSSSYLGNIKNYGAKQGRLNNNASWIAGFNDNRQWLEVCINCFYNTSQYIRH